MNCVKVVPPINKLSYQILNCISLATQKHPDLLYSAYHRPDRVKKTVTSQTHSMKDAPIFSKILSEISQIDINWPNFLLESMCIF